MRTSPAGTNVSAAGVQELLQAWSRSSPAACGGAPSGAGGCGLEEAAALPLQEQVPGWNCSPWRGAHGGEQEQDTYFMLYDINS